jgi:pyruvate/2-oxoglutarate dehydrogenase complex dihydrolipoamide dehydrogenase (E3) component
MKAVLRALTIDETAGFMKALVDPGNGRILGFTMIGPEAAEVLSVVEMAMLA